MAGGFVLPKYPKPKAPAAAHRSLLDALGPINDYVIHPTSSFVGHGLEDVKNATIGLPAGLFHLATDPKEAFPAIAKGEWQTWSPLFHGHPIAFAHQTYEHPLAPLLDALTVVTLGGAAEARVGALLADAGKATAELTRPLDAVKEVKYANPVKPGDIRLYKEPANLPGYDVYTKTFDAAKHTEYLDRSPAWVKEYETIPNGNLLHIPKNSRIGRPLAVTKKIPTYYKRYSQNPMTRRMQRGVEKSNDFIFGKMGHKDWLEQGRQFKAENLEFGRRSAATAYRLGVIFKTARVLSKHQVDPKWVESQLTGGYDKLIDTHAIPIKLGPHDTIDKSKYFFQSAVKNDAPLGFSDPNSIATWAEEKLPRRGITTSKNLAKHDGETYYVVRKGDHQNYLDELMNSMKVLGKFGNNVQKAWKYLVLGMAPRYFVNNAIGNYLMFAMHADPITTSRAIKRAIELGIDKRTALKSMNEVDRAVAKSTNVITDSAGQPVKDYVTKYFSDPTQGMQSYYAREIALNDKLGPTGIKRKINEGARSVLYGPTQLLTDVWPRRMVIDNIMSRHPMFKHFLAEEKAMGRSGAEAWQNAGERAAAMPDVHAWVTSQAEQVFGQYHTFNNVEKHIKAFVPFYGWNRAILQHSKWLVVEKPMQALALAHVSNMGVKSTEDQLGKLPEFLQGIIPLGGGKNGRVRILQTQGMNPYATVPEALKAVSSLVRHDDLKTGNPIFDQLSPVISGPVTYFSGVNPVTGAHHTAAGGLITDTLAQVFQSTPQFRLLNSIISGPNPQRPGKPTLFKGDVREQVDSVFGVPIKEMSPERAKALADLETGQKTNKPKGFKVPDMRGGLTPKRRKRYTYRPRLSAATSTVRPVSIKPPKRILPSI